MVHVLQLVGKMQWRQNIVQELVQYYNSHVLLILIAYYGTQSKFK